MYTTQNGRKQAPTIICSHAGCADFLIAFLCNFSINRPCTSTVSQPFRLVLCQLQQIPSHCAQNHTQLLMVESYAGINHTARTWSSYTEAPVVCVEQKG